MFHSPRKGSVEHTIHSVASDFTPMIPEKLPPANRKYKVPYFGGISKDGKTAYIDKDADLMMPWKGKKVDVTKYLVTHEHVEKTFLDKKHSYAFSHKLATHTEHASIAKDLGPDAPAAYEAFLKPQIARTEREHGDGTPPDLEMKPYGHTRLAHEIHEHHDGEEG